MGEKKKNPRKYLNEKCGFFLPRSEEVFGNIMYHHSCLSFVPRKGEASGVELLYIEAMALGNFQIVFSNRKEICGEGGSSRHRELCYYTSSASNSLSLQLPSSNYRGTALRSLALAIQVDDPEPEVPHTLPADKQA